MMDQYVRWARLSPTPEYEVHGTEWYAKLSVSDLLITRSC